MRNICCRDHRWDTDGVFSDRETLIPVDDIAYIDVWWTGEIGIPNSVRLLSALVSDLVT